MPIELTPGTRLGAFEILATLGEGGMGAVYRARDIELQREVAIKILHPAMATDPERLARFSREAQVLASLNHPQIAAIYGLVDADGGKALVLELVEGPTLAERIGSGPIAVEEALGIARQIADALGAAHDQGIVHRDLKPANIKLRPDGTVKVLDFGLAKAVAPEGASATAGGSGGAGQNLSMSPTLSIHATMQGLILGTAAYMSPEQASGKPVDKRADIWAFGVVLAEMLTGRRLFDGETISHVLAAVLTSQPDLTGVPPRARRLLDACLEKDPKKRLRDIGDAMSLVQNVQNVPDGPLASSSEASRPRWPRAVAWAVAGSMAVALGVTIWRSADQREAADLPTVRLQIERPSVDPYNSAVRAFAVSPDGRLLAYYTVGSKGRATLSVQTLATGGRREVAGSASLSPQPPFWSSDSRQVVYLSLQSASVFDVVTGTTRELCVCRFQGGSWSHDGVILLGSAAGDPQPIRRLSLTDRVPVPVTTVDAASGEQDSWPVFLPDGKRFVFTRTRPGNAPATYSGTLGSGEVTRITDGTLSLLAILPDNAVMLMGIDGGGLVTQAIDADTLAPIGKPTVVVAGAAAASVSSNGVLMTSGASTRPITVPMWFDRNGSELGALGPSGPITALALASDGRTAVIQEARDDGGRLWLRDGAGTNRRLDSQGGDAPVWAPDRTRLVWSSRQTGIANLYERAADGSGQTRQLFSAERNVFTNDWSSDGRWLIYTTPKADRSLDLDLWTIRMDGASSAAPIAYLAGPEREAQAEFSPDGRFVAYTSIGNSDPEVYVQPFPNASDGKWLISNGAGAEPHWSRDGKELFYFAGQTLMAVPVSLKPTFSSGTPVKLFDAPVWPWWVNDSDRTQVAPDGKRFLLLVPSGGNAAPPLDVFVNWQGMVKK